MAAKSNFLVINGKRIDISGLDPTDVDSMVRYIKTVKSHKDKYPAPAKPVKTGAKARKVLVIDDEEEICEMLHSFLTPHNYQISLAFNGQMGLEVFEEVRPDLEAVLNTLKHTVGE